MLRASAKRLFFPRLAPPTTARYAAAARAQPPPKSESIVGAHRLLHGARRRGCTIPAQNSCGTVWFIVGLAVYGGGLRAPPRAPPETDGLGAVSTPDTAHGSRFGEICGQYVNRRAIQGHSIAKCAHGRPTPTHTVLCRHIRRLFPSFPLPDKATRATHGNAWPHVTPLAANGGAVGKGEAR